MFAHGETWFHERYTGVERDDLGNPVDTWSAEVPVAGCGFAPGGNQEIVDGQRVISTPVLYVPKPVAITSRDRFTGRGVVYEIEGDPADWLHPMTGWNPGMVVVNLRRVTSL